MYAIGVCDKEFLTEPLIQTQIARQRSAKLVYFIYLFYINVYFIFNVLVLSCSVSEILQVSC